MECIILDIDGTLWDSTDEVAKSWNKVIENRSDIAFRASADNLKKLFGKPLIEIASIAFPELNKEEQNKLIDLCCIAEDEWLKKTPGQIYPDVPETISKLSRKYKVCIVSNCQAGYIELVMDALKINNYITDFECPGYSGLNKAENCQLVMKRNQIKTAVYVGDTLGDSIAAKKAGIPFVYCKYGFGDVSEYDYSIDQFSELLTLF